MSARTWFRAVGLCAVLACVAGLSCFSISGVARLRSDLNDMAKTARKIELIGAINTDVSDMRRYIRAIIMATALHEPEEVGKAKNDFAKSADRLKGSVNDVRPLLATERGKQVVAGMDSGLADLVDSAGEITRLCAAGQVPEAERLRLGKQTEQAEALTKLSAELAEIQHRLMQASLDNADSRASLNRWLVLFFIAASGTIGSLILWVIRSINKTLRQATSELSLGAEQVVSAAAQVAASSQSLAQGSSEQAASLQETSATSEEIHSMALKNAENSQSAAALVTQSRQKFDGTNVKLKEMVSAMAEINSSSDKISKIIKVIDEIAFQTNILALNAAVEAARAGEAGMGFAVVADEVRNLAQRCSQAAQDTAGLIEESIAKSNEGRVRVDDVATAMHAITEEAGQVRTLVDEVSLGSQEQSRGIEQMAKAIAQMDQVTQSSAASAEEGASAAEELNAQAEAMKDVVKRLALLVGSSAA